MRGHSPGTGRKRKSTKKRKRTGVTGVKRRRAVGRATKGGTQVYSETYRRKRRSPKKGITRRTTSKNTVAKRKRLQSGPRQTSRGRKSDSARRARLPGRRVAASGRRYSETRRNRSDAGRYR